MQIKKPVLRDIFPDARFMADCAVTGADVLVSPVNHLRLEFQSGDVSKTRMAFEFPFQTVFVWKEQSS